MRRPAWTTSAWWKVLRRSASPRAAWNWIGSRHRPAWLGRSWWAQQGWPVNLVWKWLVSCFRPPKYVEEFEETEGWVARYAALRDTEDGTYSLAREYAKERYDEVVSVSEGLDTKLDELARTALTIAAIVATAARVLGLDTALFRSPLAALAIVFSVATVFIAVQRGRRPNHGSR